MIAAIIQPLTPRRTPPPGTKPPLTPGPGKRETPPEPETPFKPGTAPDLPETPLVKPDFDPDLPEHPGPPLSDPESPHG